MEINKLNIISMSLPIKNDFYKTPFFENLSAYINLIENETIMLILGANYNKSFFENLEDFNNSLNKKRKIALLGFQKDADNNNFPENIVLPFEELVIYSGLANILLADSNTFRKVEEEYKKIKFADKKYIFLATTSLFYLKKIENNYLVKGDNDLCSFIKNCEIPLVFGNTIDDRDDAFFIKQDVELRTNKKITDISLFLSPYNFISKKNSKNVFNVPGMKIFDNKTNGFFLDTQIIRKSFDSKIVEYRLKHAKHKSVYDENFEKTIVSDYFLKST